MSLGDYFVGMVLVGVIVNTCGHFMFKFGGWISAFLDIIGSLNWVK